MDKNIFIYGLMGIILILAMDFIIDRIPKLKNFKKGIRNIFYILGVLVSIIGIISAFIGGFKTRAFIEYGVLFLILISAYKIVSNKKSK